MKNDKRTYTVWLKLKDLSLNNSWIIWLIIFFAIVSYKSGIETGLITTGIVVSGIYLGKIISALIGIIFSRIELNSINKDLTIFVITTTLLYFNLDNKLLLIYTIPISIPLIIIGILRLRR